MAQGLLHLTESILIEEKNSSFTLSSYYFFRNYSEDHRRLPTTLALSQKCALQGLWSLL